MPIKSIAFGVFDVLQLIAFLNEKILRVTNSFSCAKLRRLGERFGTVRNEQPSVFRDMGAASLQFR